MLTYQSNSFYLNGHPVLVLSGEVHYFRLPVESWSMHLDLLKETGCNTVATYVPWIVHEEIEGEIDFDGHLHPNQNLLLFLELAKQKGLMVILRPGPFIMAELKNEGLPYWLYQKYPEIIPKTWNNKCVPTATVDYLAPSFLMETKQWYHHLFQVIKPFLAQNGGNIVGIQLDNEVGMLSWVSNSPDLTDDVLKELGYPDFHDSNKNNQFKLRDLLGHTMRHRFKKYIETLKAMWESFGLKDMLYFVNIHGTSQNRGKTFPIGISQLLETYQKNGIITGTDVYFGNIDLETFHDFYIINAFTASTIHDGQPLTSLEFNVGDGNFGDQISTRYLPSAVDFKIRLSIAQNHKLLNYYLLTGGFNRKLDHIVEPDGNNRLAITGERHGFAAPIQPDGSLNYTYDKLKYTTKMMSNLQDKLSLMTEDTDDVYIGFIADYYMTEYTNPNSESIKKMQENLQFHRNSLFWDTLIKHMLLLHYRMKAIHLEEMPLTPKTHKLLILGVAQYLAKDIQEKLVNYLKQGGKVFLIGECPIYDMFGQPCTLLIDYLRVKPITTYYDWEHKNLSLVSAFDIKGAKEFRTFYCQTIETEENTLFSHAINQEKSGLISDQTIFITSLYPGYLELTESFLNHLKIHPQLKIRGASGYIFSTTMSNQSESFLHLLNLDHFDQKIQIQYKNQALFNGKTIDLFAQDGLMLPINLNLPNFDIIFSTAEIISYDSHEIEFRLTQAQDEIVIKTPMNPIMNEYVSFTQQGDTFHFISLVHSKVKSTIKLYFK
ncbi:MAG: beta-galactosidase [Acholeplasmataceae bacterium]|nr:beta-galactosidase [Acholeplasmataceae bacterium]